MKKILITLFIAAFALSVSAQDSGFGAGIIIGEPTGISLKNWLSANDALDAGVAWSVTNDWLYVHADYLRHAFNLIDVEEGQLPLYFGLGAKIGFGDDVWFGARVPLGMAYLFDGTPLDVFIELVPSLNLIPEIDFDIGGGIGVRYWF